MLFKQKIFLTVVLGFLISGITTDFATACNFDDECSAVQYCGGGIGKTCKLREPDGASCDRAGQCQSAVCTKNICVKAGQTNTGGAILKWQPIAPVLQINIPTIPLFTTKDITKTDAEGNLYIPFIGQYLAGLYKWTLAVAGIICTILILMGGFVYLTSAGNAERAKAGQERITQALLGLIFLLGSYTILYIINPDLVALKSLKIKVIQREDLPMATWSGENAAWLSLATGKKYCGCIEFRKLYTTSKVQDSGSIAAQIKKIKPDSPLSKYSGTIATLAKQYNLDPMIAIAIWQVDSNLGTAGRGKDNKNPGNIICGGGGSGSNYTCDNSSYKFRVYQKWEDGIQDWFKETDITTGPAMWRNSKTIRALITKYCPDQTAPAYIDMVTEMIIKQNSKTFDDANNGSCPCL